MLYVNGILLKVGKLNQGEVVSKIKLAVTTELTEIDVNKSCRICLNSYQKSDLYCLFSANSLFQSLSISTAINECYGVMLQQHKDLPNYVCIQCASNTLQSYTFKKCLLRSEETLKLRFLGQSVADSPETVAISTEPSIKTEDSSESIDQSVFAVSSDHNYSKGVTSSDNEVTIKNTTIKEEKDINDMCDNKTPQVLEEKKYSIKQLASDYDKWWLRSCGPPYRCKICSREYGGHYRAFYMHVRTHLMNKQPCIYCGRRFSHDKLLIHIRSHTNEKPYSCNQCPARFSLRGNLTRHLVCHTGEKPFICDICGKGFTQNSSMQTHKQIHDETTQIICEFCGKPLASKTYYKNHLNRVHKVNENLDQLSRLNVAVYKCHSCDRVFSKLQSLNLHARVHEDSGHFTCTICKQGFRIMVLYKIHLFQHEVQMLSDENEIPSCKFCSSTFSSKTSLEQHLYDHIERPFQCTFCEKSFNKKIKLSYHLGQHSEERPFSCSECGKTFRSIAALYQHKRIHSGKKPYSCEICLRSFTQQQQLASHTLTHTGEKKFVCQYCGKAFALNGNLTVHIRRHTGDTPFHCEICGKGFHDTSSRKKHMVWKHKIEQSTLTIKTESM